MAVRFPPNRLVAAALRVALLFLGGVLLVPAFCQAQPCVGDCNVDGQVSVDELVRGVNIALGTQHVGVCSSLDRDRDGTVTVDELIAAVGVALNGCEPAINVATSLAAGVVVVDPTTEAQIVAADATSITFAGLPSAVAGLKQGDIFITRDSARKVVSLINQNGNTVIQTAQPEFSEVFRILQLSGTVRLSDRDVLAPAPAGAKRVTRTTVASQGDRFVITVADPSSVLQGQVVLEQPQVDFTFNFGADNPDPQTPNRYASVHFKVMETADLTLSKAASLPSIKEDIDLLEFRRPIPIPVTAGLVQFSLVLTLHIESDGSARLSTGVHQALTYDAGMTATLNPLSVTATDATTHNFTVMSPQFDGRVHALAALQPNINIGILEYSLAGYANSFGVDASATSTANPSNTCYRLLVNKQLSGEVYVFLPKAAGDAAFSWDTFFFGDISMEKYPKRLFLFEAPLYDSGEQCSVPPVANAGPDITSQPGDTVVLDGSASHDPSGAPLESYSWTQVDGPLVFLTHFNDPVASFVAPATVGTVKLRLTVTNQQGATAIDDVVVAIAARVATPTPTPSATPPMLPPPPTAVRATAGDGRVTLRWDSVSDATSYTVYVATVSGVNQTNYDTLPDGARFAGVSSPFVDTDVTNGTKYYFVVTAANDVGEGDSSVEVAATPRAASGIDSSIASNGNARFTCVLLTTGEVACWGACPGCKHLHGCQPEVISGIADATMVAVGSNFACALLGDGTVRCWGGNAHRVLGLDSSQSSSATPVAISGIANAVAIAAGDSHACAIVDGGAIKCWGNNFRGQLGNGTVGGDSAVPVPVGGISGATAVAAGEQHTCALLGGTVRCWGYNQQGQLGESTSVDDAECLRSCPPSATPVQVRHLVDATAISVGSFHSCAVRGDGALVCWGTTGLRTRSVLLCTGGDKPLGDCQSDGDCPGGGVCQYYAERHCVGGGNRDSVCKTIENCPGGGTCEIRGSLVAPLEVTGISSASVVAASYTHTCADSDGGLRCWGYGYSGELGNGANSLFDTPAVVQNFSGASAVATGYVHTCAVSSGTVRCWGSNLSCMLGVGETNNPYTSNVPLSLDLANVQ